MTIPVVVNTLPTTPNEVGILSNVKAYVNPVGPAVIAIEDPAHIVSPTAFEDMVASGSVFRVISIPIAEV